MAAWHPRSTYHSWWPPLAQLGWIPWASLTAGHCTSAYTSRSTLIRGPVRHPIQCYTLWGVRTERAMRLSQHGMNSRSIGQAPVNYSVPSHHQPSEWSAAPLDAVDCIPPVSPNLHSAGIPLVRHPGTAQGIRTRLISPWNIPHPGCVKPSSPAPT